ncbi:hypothetical protein TNCV_2580061 [Trichonephila clavipes]|uniref:Uncharacterized protein n=1 Tax=Trichonephila clavipes TaxID=2585209 RepID=A0A8X6VHY4_TRICX|nr:hypothetical protein TNCV_2580061 [Trichonephila clavipes]
MPFQEPETKASKNGKKKIKRKKRKRKSERGSLKKGQSLDYHSRAPELSSSLDTLAGTVESMTDTVSPSLLPKNEKRERTESEVKRGYPFLSDAEESLDSLLAKERDYKSLAERSKSEKQLETYRAIIVTGGFNAKNTDDPNSGKLVLLYDPASNQWFEIGLMPKPRHHHRTVYLNDFLYLIDSVAFMVNSFTIDGRPPAPTIKGSRALLESILLSIIPLPSSFVKHEEDEKE